MQSAWYYPLTNGSAYFVPSAATATSLPGGVQDMMLVDASAAWLRPLLQLGREDCVPASYPSLADPARPCPKGAPAFWVIETGCGSIQY